MADFWAGYISGAASIIIGSPLDIIKVRLQSRSHASSQTYYSFENLGSLVRGVAAPIIGYGALNALLFVSYNRSLEFLGELPTNPMNLWKIWTAGAIGGLACFVVSAPTELVKCRAQLSPSSQTSLSIIKKIIRTRGPRGLYLGGVVTSLRDSIGYGFYFWSYEGTQQLFATRIDTQTTSTLKTLLSGGIAGCVTWLSIYPLDVIKTRVQTQAILSETMPLSQQDGAIASTELGTWECTKVAYREGGVKVFFSGLKICMFRAFLVSAVGFLVYEWTLEQLQPSKRSAGDQITI